jgi:hypothetical protein
MMRVPDGPGPGLGTPGSLVVGGVEMKAGFDATVIRQIESEVRNIKAEYRDRVPEESIDILADESIERLASSRVPQFVPLFVGRFTRERLRELVAAGSASEN